MLERELKHWLNNAYCGQLNFIEPTFGSSVGMADVELRIREYILPVETKIGTMTKSGVLHVKLRPSQYRYHITEAEKGCATAVLVAVGGATKFDVYAFAGKHCENDAYKDVGNLHIVARDQRWTDKCDVTYLTDTWNKIMQGYVKWRTIK